MHAPWNACSRPLPRCKGNGKFTQIPLLTSPQFQPTIYIRLCLLYISYHRLCLLYIPYHRLCLLCPHCASSASVHLYIRASMPPCLRAPVGRKNRNWAVRVFANTAFAPESAYLPYCSPLLRHKSSKLCAMAVWYSWFVQSTRRIWEKSSQMVIGRCASRILFHARRSLPRTNQQGGAFDLFDSGNSLRQWMLASPERSRLIGTYFLGTSYQQDHSTEGDRRHHEDWVAFQKICLEHATNLYTINASGNLFTLDCPELVVLGSGDCTTADAITNLRSQSTAQQQYDEFVAGVLQNWTAPSISRSSITGCQFSIRNDGRRKSHIVFTHQLGTTPHCSNSSTSQCSTEDAACSIF